GGGGGDGGASPIIKSRDVPKIAVRRRRRQDQPPLGVGESASVPSAAAIANAIFDATGVRFRNPPFTPERILQVLRGEAPSAPEALPAPAAGAPANKRKNPFAARPSVFAGLAAVCATAIAIGTAAL